jgi:hypothetical protein
MKEAVTNPMQPPSVVKVKRFSPPYPSGHALEGNSERFTLSTQAMFYAKNLPEAFTGEGANELPRQAL